MSEMLKLYCFGIIFILYRFSLAMAQADNQFIYNGFAAAPLQLFGALVQENGLLQLTNTLELRQGKAFHSSTINSSSQTLFFSTNFVFAIVPATPNLAGHGLVFVMAPSMDFSSTVQSKYLGIFNDSNNGDPSNHIFAVELDTVQNPEFNDIDGNHVGIDVNGLNSVYAASATYFSDTEQKNMTLELDSGSPMQLWIEYNGTEKLMNVTLAPVGMLKPSKPLMSASIDLSQILLDTAYIGFSAATGTRETDHYVLGWSFNQTGPAQDLDINDLPSIPQTAEGPVPAKSVEHRKYIIVAVIVAGLVMVMAIGGGVYFVRKKRYGEVYEDWEKEYGPQRFLYKDLYKATNGFRDKEVIGKGGFGKVYRGVLPTSNVEIAVKRISHDSKQGMKEFIAEIATIGKLRHRNLVQLCGYCRRRGELLLVYDYMPNGSLDKLLYNSDRPHLNWFQRLRILKGVASGLFYLHEEWEQVVLHRDIKPGNVLLDADLSGKLGDFGLARLHDHDSNPQTTKLVGTIGYLAPELPNTGKASTSTDVYAFGVLMLEVATGKRPFEQQGYVIESWKSGTILNASDPTLNGDYPKNQMELVLKLGLFCSHSKPEARPSMPQVMQILDGDATLPDIPTDHVIDFFSVANQYSDVMSLYTPFLTSNSVQMLTTTDSILIEGR